MPTMTPSNHLFFYQLLSREMGVGKQTALTRVEEILAEADVLLDDVDCATIEELLAMLDFVRVTTFKKGRVFATVAQREDLEELLAKAEQPVIDKAAAATGKSWKRARRTKDVRPQKPRHKRPAKAPEPVEELPVEAEVTMEDAVQPEPTIPEPTDSVATQAVPEPDATSVLEAAVLETSQVESEPEVEAPLVVQQKPEPEPAPQPEPELKPAPQPEPEPKPVPEIISNPEPVPTAEPDPVPTRYTRPRKPLRAATLPNSISEDVFCPSELLLALYQALPHKRGILETLDESWAFAQEAGTAEGNRTRMTFPLSRVIEGQPPIEVTIARAPHLPSGKFWKLVAVDDGSSE